MSNRVHSFVVTLDIDLRDADAEEIAGAIRQLRHVVAVTAHTATIESKMAAERARHDLMERVIRAIQDT